MRPSIGSARRHRLGVRRWRGFPKPAEGSWTEHYPGPRHRAGLLCRFDLTGVRRARTRGHLQADVAARRAGRAAPAQRELLHQGDRGRPHVGHRRSRRRARCGRSTTSAGTAATSSSGLTSPDEETSGTARQFACKYHGWRYGLDGGCPFVQQEGEFFDLDKADYGLVAVHCDSWAGFIFVNLESQPRQRCASSSARWSRRSRTTPSTGLPSATRSAPGAGQLEADDGRPPGAVPRPIVHGTSGPRTSRAPLCRRVRGPALPDRRAPPDVQLGGDPPLGAPRGPDQALGAAAPRRPVRSLGPARLLREHARRRACGPAATSGSASRCSRSGRTSPSSSGSAAGTTPTSTGRRRTTRHVFEWNLYFAPPRERPRAGRPGDDRRLAEGVRPPGRQPHRCRSRLTLGFGRDHRLPARRPGDPLPPPAQDGRRTGWRPTESRARDARVRRAGGHELVRRARPPRQSHARRSRSRSSRARSSPMGRWRAGATALAARSARTRGRRGDVVGLLSYNCPEFLETIFAANYLGAIAMPINWRLAAPEVRYILEHSEARALVCDESLVELANEATKGMEAALVRACISHLAPRDGRRSPISGPRRTVPRAGRRRRRRHPPVDVHVGHHGTPEGRHDHPRQPGVEEPRPPRRVRLHERRSRARLRSPVPRRSARPHDHLADRRRSDDHHPSGVRRVRRRRRARAIAGDHCVAGARHGQRHHDRCPTSSSATSRRCG